MRNINVVHICDKFGMRGSTIHGVSRLFGWWFPRFDHARFNVKLFALKKPDPPSRALEADGVRMQYMSRSAFDPWTLASFLKVIRENQADVVHLHGWIAANYGRIAGRITRTPTIMHEHGVDPKLPLTQRIADRILSRWNQSVVAVSRSVRNFLVARRCVPPDRIRIIYNGAPLGEFSPADPAVVAETRRSLGITKDYPVVGTIGRLDTQKGITYLLRAARRVLDTTPDVRFVVVGDGPKRDDLQAEAQDLGLGGNVIFTGHRTDVPVVQTMLDVQVFPSLWEGTPLTIFEAMAMGRTILSTNVDGLGEVLEDGRNALVVEPASPGQLADGIIRLLSDRDLAGSLAGGARESGNDFDISRTVRDLESLYEELAHS